MTTSSPRHPLDHDTRYGVDLYWLPLGAGARAVRTAGRIYEWALALVQRRRRLALYHSALEVRVPAGRFVIEMAPRTRLGGEDHGAVATGSVGSELLGAVGLFKYEIRRWRSGRIDDRDAAVESPVHVSVDLEVAERLLELAPFVPTPVWGRDTLMTGEMWNSNSVTSWLLVTSGVDLAGIAPPVGGRAPGWVAGTTEAARIPPWTSLGPCRRRALLPSPQDRALDQQPPLPLLRRRHSPIGAGEDGRR